MVNPLPAASVTTGGDSDTRQAGRALAIDRFEDGDEPRPAQDRDADPGRRSRDDPAALAVLTDPEQRAAVSRAYRALVERAQPDPSRRALGQPALRVRTRSRTARLV
jgi:hypothetical protein